MHPDAAGNARAQSVNREGDRWIFPALRISVDTKAVPVVAETGPHEGKNSVTREDAIDPASRRGEIPGVCERRANTMTRCPAA